MSKKTLRNMRLTAGGLALCLFAAALTTLAANYPPWWSYRGVIDTQVVTNDFAAVNAGQLKHFAAKAKQEFDTALPGGAGAAVIGMVASFSATNNYNAINIGQLKYVAKPFYDRLIAVGYTNTYPWTTNTVADDNDFAAVNVGQLKRVFSFDVSQMVFNQPPTCVLTSPPPGAVFAAPAMITFQAGASDPDGTVTKVEFYRGTVKLGEVATAPYSMTWNNVVSGSYSLTARAFDNGGLVTTSTTVNINVLDPNADADSDGLPNGWEVANGTNPFVNDSSADPDADGLTNLQEYQRGTDPRNADTDHDKLTDGYEVHTSGTNPLDFDSNDNGIGDGAEISDAPLTGVPGPAPHYPYSADFDGDAFKIQPAGLSVGGQFGHTIAVSEDDIAVVGAPGANKVYFFKGSHNSCGTRDPGTWTQMTVIPSDWPASFGSSVAIRRLGWSSEHMVLVGAPDAQQVWIYQSCDGVWSPGFPPLLTPQDGFAPGYGESIAMSDDHIVVGAPGAGKVYIYDYAGFPEAVLQGGSGFGAAVDIDQTSDLVVTVDHSGLVYPYRKHNNTWTVDVPIVSFPDLRKTISVSGYIDPSTGFYVNHIHVGTPEIGILERYTSLQYSPCWMPDRLLSETVAGLGTGLGAALSRNDDPLAWQHMFIGDLSSTVVGVVDLNSPSIGNVAVWTESADVFGEPKRLINPTRTEDSKYGCAIGTSLFRILVGASNCDNGKGAVFAHSSRGWYLGDLSGQHDWQASIPRLCMVQNDVVFQGDAALEIKPWDVPVVLWRDFYWWSFEFPPENEPTINWIDYRLKPTFRLSDDVPTLDPKVPTAFYFDESGRPVVYDGANGWTTLTCNPISSHTWVQVTVREDYLTQKWDLFLNNVCVAYDLSFACNTTGNQFRRRAFYGSKRGTEYIDSFSVTLSRDTCTIVAPSNGSVLSAGDKVPVRAVVSQHDALVTKVEFYVDNVKIGQDGTSPYEVLWTDIPAGTHDLMAKAYNNNGSSIFSENVTVVVTPESGSSSFVSLPDNYTVTENTTLTIPAPGVLGNDIGVSLTAQLGTPPANGELVLQSDGSFSYTPQDGYLGSDSFTYQISDGQNLSEETTVTLQIVTGPQEPWELFETFDPRNFESGTLDGNHGWTCSQPDATTFWPFSDTYQYLVITPINGPVVVSHPMQVPSQHHVIWEEYGFYRFFAWNDGEYPAAIASLNAAIPAQFYIRSDGSIRVLDGTVWRTANVSVWQTVETLVSVKYNLDTKKWSLFIDTTSVTFPRGSEQEASELSFAEVNGVPIPYTGFNYILGTDANAQNLYAIYDVNVSSGVMITDPGNGSVLPFTTWVQISGRGIQSLADNGGVFDLFLDDVIHSSWVCYPIYPGEHTVKVRSTDANGHAEMSSPVTFTIQSGTPVADTYTTHTNVALVVPAPGVRANDTYSQGAGITVVLTSLPIHGTLSLSPDGSFTYTPPVNWPGVATFQYRTFDGWVYSTPATVTITVYDAPTARRDVFVQSVNSTLSVPAPGILANDFSPETLNLTAELVTGPADGQFSLQSDGSFTYTPLANWSGVTSFTYRATCGTSKSSPATVRIIVQGVNHAPVVVNDTYTTVKNMALTPTAPGVLGNDTDSDGQTLFAILVQGPTHGTLTLDRGGSFVYTPNANWTGADSFSYQAFDGLDLSANATVNITVLDNNTPVGGADTYSVLKNATLKVPTPGVLINDNHPDGRSIYTTLFQGPSHGALTLHRDGSFVYTPTANWTGSDSFSYKVTDGSTPSASVTVTITVMTDTDNDGMPDIWENQKGLNPAVNDAGLDPDNDGWTNLQEYLRGSDPHRPLIIDTTDQLKLRIETPLR